jgi:hypothetical protein
MPKSSTERVRAYRQRETDGELLVTIRVGRRKPTSYRELAISRSTSWRTRAPSPTLRPSFAAPRLRPAWRPDVRMEFSSRDENARISR